jgi:acetolactate synthase small subunit
MELDLNQKEKALLRDILKNYMSDFRMEIADTSTPDYRSQLKAQEEILNRIIEKIEKSK